MIAHLLAFVVCLAFLAQAEAADRPKLRTIARGAFSGIQEPKQLVVTNSVQWTKLWNEHSALQKPAKPAPEVDFEKETVLFVSLGQKRSGGYSVEIVGTKETDGKVEVQLRTREPKKGGFQLQAITSPFHIVAVPKIDAPVKFRIGP